MNLFVFHKTYFKTLYIVILIFQCQRHQLILADGKRSGFFLADGTGVGKGRQVS